MSFTGQLTGGVFDPQGPGYGALATQNEKQRQALINQGLSQINAIFGGGATSFYSMANAGGAKYDPHAPYYYLTGKGFQPYQLPGDTRTDHSFLGNLMHAPGQHGPILTDLGDALNSIFGGSEPSPQEIARQQFQRGKLLNKTDATYQGFDDKFYDQRATDYLNYALPQEAKQYKTNLDAITYDLADRGILQSTAANKAFSDLNQTAAGAKQTVADSALAQSNQLRQNVENARQTAIGQLYQTGDPNLAASNAIGVARSASQPSVFQPIANLFGNLATTYYTNQLLNSYRNPGTGTPQYGSGYYDMSGALPNQ